MQTTKLVLFKKENEYKGRTFPSYFTKVLIPVKQNDSSYVKEEKYLTVKFRQCCNIGTLDIKKKGCIEVDSTMLDVPYTYTIKEENGKKKYPEIWVRGGIVSYNEIKAPNQTAFVGYEEPKQTSFNDDSNYSIPDEDLPFNN